jgi:hypothetical protein
MEAKMRMMRILIMTVIGFLFFPLSVNAATIYVANYGDGTCAQANVTAAMNAAKAGDTIVLPSGNCVWKSRIEVNKNNLTFQGQTSGCPDNCGSETTITQGDDYGFNFHGYTTRVTQIKFVATGNSTLFITGETISDFRIDHCYIKKHEKLINKAGRGRKSGLIDNNHIEDCDGECIYVVGEGNNSWAQGGALGNDYPEGTVYIEDNKFTLTTAGSMNIFDAGGGARVVFRYNTVISSTYSWSYMFEGHGHCYGFRDESHNAGTYGVEIYENAFQGTTGAAAGAIYKNRGGRGYFYNNSFQYTSWFDQYHNMIYFVNDEMSGSDCNGDAGPCPNQYHEDTKVHPVPLESGWNCDTYPDDYPCPLQLNNFYIWGNTTQGTLDPSPLGNFAQEDRDYWDDVGAGDTNFSSGLSSARPGTCSDDDSYWETDTKKLYRCVGTNNWTFIYQPFTYPHPLTGRPSPPKALRIVGP